MKKKRKRRKTMEKGNKTANITTIFNGICIKSVAEQLI